MDPSAGFTFRTLTPADVTHRLPSGPAQHPYAAVIEYAVCVGVPENVEIFTTFDVPPESQVYHRFAPTTQMSVGFVAPAGHANSSTVPVGVTRAILLVPRRQTHMFPSGPTQPLTGVDDAANAYSVRVGTGRPI